MIDATVRLKGYRCFSHDHFGQLRLRPGVIALLGANNSGKSTLMRALYELKTVLVHGQEPSGAIQLARGDPIGGNYAGVEDPLEIFNDQHEDPVRLEIDFHAARHGQISRLALVAERSQPTLWKGQLFAGPDFAQVANIDQWDPSHLHAFGAAMASTMYVGPYRNLISEAKGAYYDVLIGTNFVAQWDDLKTGPGRLGNQMTTRLSRDLARVFGFRSLEINASPDRTTVQVIVDDRPYRLRELGAGFAQFLHVLVTTALRKPSYLLIDEPEAHLHPALQLKLIEILQTYTSEGLVLATHSLGLARSVSTELLSLHRSHEGVTVRPFEDARTPAELLGELSFASFRELGVRGVLFVEGKHDVPVIRDWMRRLGKEAAVVVLPLRGMADLSARGAGDLADVLRLADRVAVLIDSEREVEGGPVGEARQGFATACEGAGIEVCMTERRALENYFSQEAIDRALGQEFRALGAYGRMRDAGRPWDKGVNWRIASHMTVAEVEATDVGRFLKSL